MRTTLDIDEDVLAAAKELARAEGRTMGEVISDLARKGLTQPCRAGFAEARAGFGEQTSEWPAFPVLPNRTGRIVTTEDVKRIQFDTELEDGVAWDHEADKPRDFGNVKKKR